jgi:drug/metabolite transporter (DMT)-like permease
MSSKSNSSVRPYFLLALGVLSIGFSAIFVRWAGAPGTVTSFYRMAIAAGLMVIPFVGHIRRREGITRRGVWLAILGGALFAGDLSFWATGIILSGATNPTLMANTAPLWVGLGSVVIFREKLRGKFWLGLSLAMIGAIIVLGQDLQKANTFGIGTFFGLIAAIFYGGYFLITQRGREHLDSLTYFWIASMSSAFILFIINQIFDRPLLGYPSFTYINFLSLGIVVQVIGWLAINHAQGFLPASVVAPTLLAQPVITGLFSVPLLGETFTFWHLLGGFGVLIGIYIVHLSRWEHKTS